MVVKKKNLLGAKLYGVTWSNAYVLRHGLLQSLPGSLSAHCFGGHPQSNTQIALGVIGATVYQQKLTFSCGRGRS